MIGLVKFRHKGNFENTRRFFMRIRHGDIFNVLDRYARDGVQALAGATPVDTGDSAGSWGYNIIIRKDGARIEWTNSNMAGRVPVVILIQYGHATRGGTFVQGRDFINPTMRPIFQNMADGIWKEVSDL